MTAVEPHPAALAACRAAAPFADVLQGDIETLGDCPRSVPAAFDVVAAFDVIEHLQDDVGRAAASSACFIAEGGQLVLTVPALELLWGGARRRQRALPPLHRARSSSATCAWRATRSSTSRTSAPCSSRCVAAVRVGRRLRPTAPAAADSDFKLSVRPVNELLTRLFALEAKVVARHRLPIGSSLVAVARPV